MLRSSNLLDISPMRNPCPNIFFPSLPLSSFIQVSPKGSRHFLKRKEKKNVHCMLISKDAKSQRNHLYKIHIDTSGPRNSSLGGPLYRINILCGPHIKDGCSFQNV